MKPLVFDTLKEQECLDTMIKSYIICQTIIGAYSF